MQDSLISKTVPASSIRERRSRVAIGVCLFALTITIYLPALKNQFVDWDDFGYVAKNPQVAGGLNLAGLAYAWTTFDVGNWIPLTWMSYELDATLFGINPIAFHAENILWHAINVVLLFFALHRMTDAIWRSAIVAALFAVHPLHVESVAWISERKDLLSTCGLLVVLVLYERYAKRPSVWRMVGVCGAYAIGLLAKSMLVTVPILLLLIDTWPLRRWPGQVKPGSTASAVRPYSVGTSWQLFTEKFPLCLLAMFECTMTVRAQWGSAVIALESETIFGRLLQAFDSVRWYLATTFIPYRLSAYYPHPGTVDLDWIEHSWPRLVFSMLVVLAVTVIVIWRQREEVQFGWFWFLISLLPVIGLIQVGSQAYADRYTYIPHIGLFIAMVWGASRFLATNAAGRNVGVLITLICLSACSGLTQLQIATWRTTESLWRNAVEVDPANLFAQLKLGIELYEQQRFDEAEERLSEAVLLFPNLDTAIYYLGNLHEARGEELLARAYFEWLLRSEPNHSAARRSLSAIYRRQPPVNQRVISQGVLQEIESGVRRGARITRQRHWAEGLTHFDRAIAMDPNCGMALRFAGDALEELGRFDESQKRFEAAIELDPLDVEARHALLRIARRRSKPR